MRHSIHVRRTDLARIGSIGLAYLAAAIVLLAATPAVALQSWYVLAVPMVLAATLYGPGAAAIMSGAGVGMLMVIFWAAGTSFAQVTGVLERLISASTS